MQQGVEFLGSVGQGATFGFADEAAAGIRSILPGYQDYDAELAAIRQGRENFKEQSPALNFIGELGGSLALPAGAIGKGATTAAKMANAAKVTAPLGALYGFGSREGGFQNRAQGALVDGAVSAVAAPLMVAGGEGVKKLLKGAGDDFERMALNVQRSDIKKADKFSRVGDGKASRITQALQTAREKGLFSGDRSADGLLGKADDLISGLGDETQAALKAVDAVQTDVVFPTMSNAEKFIANSPYEAEKLSKQFQQRMETLNKEWDGTVSGLNSMKSKLYKIGYAGSTESKALDRAIAKDLKEAVEVQAKNLLGEEGSDAILAANRAQGDILTLKPILEKGKQLDEMPGGAAKGLRRLVVSPVGGGALGLFGAATGSTPLVLPALLAAAATTRKGLFVLSDAARAGASAAGKVASTPSASVAELTSALTRMARPEAKGSQEPEKGQLQSLQALAKPQTSQQPSMPRSAQSVSPKSSLTSSSKNRITNGVSKSSVEMEVLAEAIAPAVARIESGGDSKAVSAKGARGLMQLMPENIKTFGVTNPDDPEQSMKAGIKLLAEELTRFQDIRLALAAYNAGSPAVNRAIKKAGTRDPDKVIALLSAETRNYVPKVMKALDVET
jgi:soluble lytic murein transglycosylase-like protein